MVEKKRRDKMAQYVTELSTMIPMCGVMQRKLDKITVLRMAVQHVKAIKGMELLHSTYSKVKLVFHGGFTENELSLQFSQFTSGSLSQRIFLGIVVSKLLLENTSPLFLSPTTGHMLKYITI